MFVHVYKETTVVKLCNLECRQVSKNVNALHLMYISYSL